MASSLLALLDDIANVLDDVSLMTQKAASKTAGVVGDDVALNADQLNGISPDKELPIIYAVAKGAMLNKVILIPIALAISFWIPSLVTVLLMIGGTYLCFEGVEKIIDKLFHSKDKNSDSKVEVSQEQRIKGAIRTDFILSAEIIIIALGTMANSPIMTQIISLCIIGLVMNFGVYGFVAFIVKIDDFGLFLQKRNHFAIKGFGYGLIKTAPVLMKLLGVLGTAAMFSVGGGIISHGIHIINQNIEQFTNNFKAPMNIIFSILAEMSVGAIAGLIAVGFLYIFKKMRK